MTNQTQTVSVNTGGGWAILATLVLVVLKVNPGGHLDSPVQDWPWWLVLIPLWLGLAIILTLLIVGGIVALVVTQTSEWRRKRRYAKAQAQREALREQQRASMEARRKDMLERNKRP